VASLRKDRTSGGGLPDCKVNHRVNNTCDIEVNEDGSSNGDDKTGNSRSDRPVDDIRLTSACKMGSRCGLLCPHCKPHAQVMGGAA